MYRIIFVVPPFLGHINPLLSIGLELKQRGHEVLWICPTEINPSKLPDKIDIIVPQEMRKYQSQIKLSIDKARQNLSVSYSEGMNTFLSEAIIPMNKMIYTSIERIAREFCADIIVNDNTMFSAGIYAYKKKIPYATSWSEAPGFYNQDVKSKYINWHKNSMLTKLQKDLGIDGDNIVCCSNRLNLSFTSKLFSTEHANLMNYEFVGPVTKHRLQKVELDINAILNCQKKKIYITMGTIIQKEEVFYKKLIQSFAHKDCLLFINAHANIPIELPKHFIQIPFNAHLQILPHMDIVISHGGFNTVCETLECGIPLILMPMINDQFESAKLIMQHACGQYINAKRFKPELLSKKVDEVIENPDYRNAAKLIQKSFFRAGGTDQAANLILNLMSEDSNCAQLR